MTSTIPTATGRAARLDAAKQRMRVLLAVYHREPRFRWDTGQKACSDADPKLFTPADVEGDRSRNFAAETESRRNHEVARTWCARCPLIEECLAEALWNEREGTWGGERFTALDWEAGRAVKKELGL